VSFSRATEEGREAEGGRIQKILGMPVNTWRPSRCFGTCESTLESNQIDQSTSLQQPIR